MTYPAPELKIPNQEEPLKETRFEKTRNADMRWEFSTPVFRILKHTENAMSYTINLNV